MVLIKVILVVKNEINALNIDQGTIQEYKRPGRARGSLEGGSLDLRTTVHNIQHCMYRDRPYSVYLFYTRIRK